MPMIRTYPPRGRALTPYSVSPFLIDHRRGPNPKKYSVTFIPAHLAVTKCPNSWSMTMAMMAKITAKNGENPVTTASTRTMATKYPRRNRRSRLSISTGALDSASSRLLTNCVMCGVTALSSEPPAVPAPGPAGLHRSQRRQCSALFRRAPPRPHGSSRQSRSKG